MVAHSSVVNLKRRGKNPVDCVFQTSRQEPCWLRISSSSLAIWRRNGASNSDSDDGYIIQVGSTVCQKYALTGDRNHRMVCFRSVTK